MKFSSFSFCLLFLVSACGNPDNKLFEQVKSGETGIDFTNRLSEWPKLNILYYLYYYNGAGVAVGDINNDGLTDVYFVSNTRSSNKLYLNKGNWKFEDITKKAGVEGISDWYTGVTMADINGDGLLDIYAVSASGDFGLKGRNTLYINKGNLTFEEKAFDIGLGFSALGTQAAFFDYDHDGDLDCYLLNHSKRPHANLVPAANRMNPDSVKGDKLLRNLLSETGQLKFEDVSSKAGIYRSTLGYGLGISIADFNNDGWEDVYIGNDFHENDYFYLNNGDGTFAERGNDFFGHFSRFSMGNDAADINNDGNIDLITVDMLPPDEKTLKTYGSDENLNSYLTKIVANGYGHQVSRNCIQRNMGNSSFSDVAFMGDAVATDWSWCPLLADFDNDGLTDLFVSSGIVKRPVDLDYVMYVSALSAQKGMDLTDAFDAEAIEKMPDGATHPFFFKGNGKFGFEDVSAEWGTANLRGYFNGSAYADFDNDGDLDIVINSIDAKAMLLRNNNSSKPYIRVKFDGNNANTSGIGTKAILYTRNGKQFKQLMPTRGFLSSSEPVLHFGLANATAVDSLLILWPTQQYQVIRNPAINGVLSVKQNDAIKGYKESMFFNEIQPPFEDVSLQHGIQWSHRENEFIDFNRQYLLPHMQSSRGPKVCVSDVNNDGLEDFYICGASNQSGQLMLQTASGVFVQGNIAAFARNSAAEEVDAAFFDADGDGDQDLYVVSGGYQYSDGDSLLSDHLYFNNGKGVFSERTSTIPDLLHSKSCLAVSDIDGDNDMDIFVGSLAPAGRFGFYQASTFLINDGKGNFSSSMPLPVAENESGMITSALFGYINSDNKPDLIVAGEWMPITFYLNQNGTWKKSVIPESSGLWQTISFCDINNDGKQDLLAGNWGLNGKLANRKDGPLKMYVNDFDKNGREEQIVAYTVNGKEYTFLAKDELERALPVLKRGYLTYKEVAGQTVQYMFYDLFKDYREWKAETLASSVFLNTGNGVFKRQELPFEWQLAPVFAFSASPDGRFISAGGNFYGVIPYEGRYDAMMFSTFKFDNKGENPEFIGGMPELKGEIRDAKWIKVKNEMVLLVARNNSPVFLLRPLVK